MENTTEKILKVAGVTFPNADGEKRQDILRNFGIDTYITVNLRKETFVNPETGVPELAIACIERNSKKQIGYIPRADIEPGLLQKRQLTGIVKFFNDIYYCQLGDQQPPDSEMYENMKQICAASGIPMPAYDVRAYIQFSEKLNQPAVPSFDNVDLDNDYPF